MRPEPARLPIQIRPAHHETIPSYIARIAAVHSIRYRTLWNHLSAPAPGHPTRRLIVIERLATATGRPATALQHALLELADPAPDWRQYRYHPQPTCRRCTASHPGGTVQQLRQHHEYLCTHGHWHGPATLAEDITPQHLTPAIPELMTAQQQHDQLVHDHGWNQTYRAYEIAIYVATELHLPQRRPNPDKVWDHRLNQLIPNPRRNFSNSLYHAALHPEAIQLAALICTPPWNFLMQPDYPSHAYSAVTPHPHNDQLDQLIRHALRLPERVGNQPTYPAHVLYQAAENQRRGPDHTYIHTRRRTPDGNPSTPVGYEASRISKARHEYVCHRPVRHWMLIQTGHRA